MLAQTELENILSLFWVDATLRPTVRSFSLDQKGAIADRIRVAAFAEWQAIQGFHWAIETFADIAPAGLIERWRMLIPEEEKHLQLLIKRAQELNLSLNESAVSDSLLIALKDTKTPKEFCILMCDAEDRGRKAGLRFYDFLKKHDSITADIFHLIAIEEEKHIHVVLDYYPEAFAEFKALKSQLPTHELLNHLAQKQ